MAISNLNTAYMLTDSGSGNRSSVSKKTINPNYASQGGTLHKQINPAYTSGSSGSGSGSGSGSASASADSGYSADYGVDYSAVGGGGGGGDYASMIAQMLAEQRAAAQNAYNASKARLDQAYDDTYSALKNNLSSALDRMQKNYEYGRGVQNDDANKSLREAYVNYMMNKRNLAQNLAAAGLSGGATESNMANMYNNYGSSRNNINTTLAQNLAQLLNTYENNVAAANQAYNEQWAGARQNYANQLNSLEQMLAGNLMSNYSGSSLSSLASFAKTLADLTGQTEAAMNVFTPTENTLGIDNYTTTQGNNMGTITDYAKYLEMLERMGA